MYLIFLQGKRTFTRLADCTNQLHIKRLPQALFPGFRRLASKANGTLSQPNNFLDLKIFFCHLEKWGTICWKSRMEPV
jgi:hypothetical protein